MEGLNKLKETHKKNHSEFCILNSVFCILLKKTTTLLLASLLTLTCAFSQDWEWVLHSTSGAFKSEKGTKIALDSEKNIIIAGTFTDSMSLSGIVLDENTTDNRHGYIAKYDSNGTILWVKTIKSLTNLNDGLYQLKTDNENNIYY
ncbi:MAG: hypothetical protein ACP5DZ_11490, partial [Bacteroidales bacterium]